MRPLDAIGEAEKPIAPIFDRLCADPALPAGAVRWADARGDGLQPGPATAEPDDLCVLPYTSGTTGLPKGCMHTHRTRMPNVIGGGLWAQSL